jgi:hypothetical protein
MSENELPPWRTPYEAARAVIHGPHLAKTLFTALIVGTILFAINHLDTVLRGQATAGTWIEIGVTYLVPFAVANIGVLLATCRRSP